MSQNLLYLSEPDVSLGKTKSIQTNLSEITDAASKFLNGVENLTNLGENFSRARDTMSVVLRLLQQAESDANAAMAAMTTWVERYQEIEDASMDLDA